MRRRLQDMAERLISLQDASRPLPVICEVGKAEREIRSHLRCYNMAQRLVKYEVKTAQPQIPEEPEEGSGAVPIKSSLCNKECSFHCFLADCHCDVAMRLAQPRRAMARRGQKKTAQQKGLSAACVCVWCICKMYSEPFCEETRPLLNGRPCLGSVRRGMAWGSFILRGVHVRIDACFAYVPNEERRRLLIPRRRAVPEATRISAGHCVIMHVGMLLPGCVCVCVVRVGKMTRQVAAHHPGFATSLPDFINLHYPVAG